MNTFSDLLEEFRIRRGINKKQLAHMIDKTPGYVSLLTRGERLAPSFEVVMNITKALELSEEERSHFFEVTGYSSLYSSSALEVFSEQQPSDLHNTDPTEGLSEEQRHAIPRQQAFYGRERELEQLQQLILGLSPVHCLAVLGMGGVGKTSLTIELAERIQREFTYTAWYPFQTLSEETFTNIIMDCLHFFSEEPEKYVEDDVQSKLEAFIACLQRHRCLIILDNFESLLKSGSLMGEYADGYDDYGTLLELVCSRPHASCLVLTSREKPKEVAHSEGMGVKTLVLSGVEDEDGRQILRDKGLMVENDAWRGLVQLYSGNPFALQLVSTSIRDVFGGDIAVFLNSLEEQQVVVSVVHDLLDQQFRRLSEMEKEVMYWLAIEREAVDTRRLREDILNIAAKPDLLNVLEALLRRSFIERRDTTRFGLRPLVMEYITDQLVQTVYEEIDTQQIALLENHTLIKAEIEDYIRKEQMRSILDPLKEKLFASFNQPEIEAKLRSLLTTLRKEKTQKLGYTAGNILNLLIYLEYDLHGYDFSFLTVRQAYLREKGLPQVNFAHANLSGSVFADTFGSVLSVALSPNGKLLAVGTANGEVRIWEMEKRRLLHNWKGHSDWVRSIAFSADGKLLASGSHDQTIRLWNVDTGQGVGLLHGHENRVRAVTFGSINGRLLLASSSDDKTIRIWDVQTGGYTELRGHTDKINAIAFSPDNRTLISVSHDETIRIWNIESGDLLQELHGQGGWIWSVAFCSNTRFACGNEDGTVSLWDTYNDNGILTFHCTQTLLNHSARVYTVSFSSANKDILISGSDDETVRVWNMNTGRGQLLRGHTNGVRSCVSHDGFIIVSGSDDETVRIWNANNNQCLYTLQGYSGWVHSVAFNSNAAPLLVSAGEDRHVRVWDASSGKRLPSLHGHTHRVRAVAFSPDNSRIASASDDQTVRIWETETSIDFPPLRGHRQRVRSISFSPDNSRIASASDDQTVRIWETETGMCLYTIEAHLSRVYSVSWSPDGNFLASSSEDQHIYLWDAHTYERLGVFSGHKGRIYSVRFSPDSTFLISGGDDKVIRLWDVSTRKCIREMRGHSRRICSLTYTTDGQLFASASEDKTARVWNASTGELVHTITGHNGKISSIASFGTTLFATGSYDGTIKLWQPQTGEHLRTLRSPRPYEDVDITDVRGLTAAQKATLKILGAVENF